MTRRRRPRKRLLAAADTTDNPDLAAWALFAYGMAHRDVGSRRRL